LYQSVIKPWLFRKDAEEAHHFAFQSLQNAFRMPLLNQIIAPVIRSRYTLEHPNLERKVMGLTFKNPIGLAAGFDKDAVLINELSAFGFGFIEIGTLTPKPQAGNPKPRLFRLPTDSALINRMGFNNGGIENVIPRLEHYRQSIKAENRLIIGGNIGKNKVTPNSEAVRDYEFCFEQLFDWVDYFTVNVSSPNTPNLRDLQEKEPLTKLLSILQEKNHQKSNPKPILLKIAPDLTDFQLDDILDIVQTTRIAGVIATNTTISRSNLITPETQVSEIGAGGLSGKPLQHHSTQIIQYLRNNGGKKLVIIGVGGIFTGEDAIEKLEAGADLVQIYTGFVYGGPVTVKNINRKLIQHFIS